MAGQCLQSNQHEADTTPGGRRRQEGLACSGPWGHEESDTTKRLNTHTHHGLRGNTWIASTSAYEPRTREMDCYSLY